MDAPMTIQENGLLDGLGPSARAAADAALRKFLAENRYREPHSAPYLTEIRVNYSYDGMSVELDVMVDIYTIRLDAPSYAALPGTVRCHSVVRFNVYPITTVSLPS